MRQGRVLSTKTAPCPSLETTGCRIFRSATATRAGPVSQLASERKSVLRDKRLGSLLALTNCWAAKLCRQSATARFWCPLDLLPVTYSIPTVGPADDCVCDQCHVAGRTACWRVGAGRAPADTAESNTCDGATDVTLVASRRHLPSFCFRFCLEGIRDGGRLSVYLATLRADLTDGWRSNGRRSDGLRRHRARCRW